MVHNKIKLIDGVYKRELSTSDKELLLLKFKYDFFTIIYDMLHPSESTISAMSVLRAFNVQYKYGFNSVFYFNFNFNYLYSNDQSILYNIDDSNIESDVTIYLKLHKAEMDYKLFNSDMSLFPLLKDIDYSIDIINNDKLNITLHLFDAIPLIQKFLVEINNKISNFHKTTVLPINKNIIINNFISLIIDLGHEIEQELITYGHEFSFLIDILKEKIDSTFRVAVDSFNVIASNNLNKINTTYASINLLLYDYIRTSILYGGIIFNLYKGNAILLNKDLNRLESICGEVEIVKKYNIEYYRLLKYKILNILFKIFSPTMTYILIININNDISKRLRTKYNITPDIYIDVLIDYCTIKFGEASDIRYSKLLKNINGVKVFESSAVVKLIIYLGMGYIK